MNHPQRADIALNLSYALHERSDSDTVRAYVDALEAERRRCTKAMRHFVQLTSEDLHQRLIVLNTTGMTGGDSLNDVAFVSVNIGAVDLLPRLLHVSGLRPERTGGHPCLLDGPLSREVERLPFFGSPAALNVPESGAGTATRWLFAAAVFRPGRASMLLRLHWLTDDGSGVWPAAARHAEQVIREFPLQWWCDRPLWDRPVEDTLPEFQTAENGTDACGH